MRLTNILKGCSGLVLVLACSMSPEAKAKRLSDLELQVLIACYGRDADKRTLDSLIELDFKRPLPGMNGNPERHDSLDQLVDDWIDTVKLGDVECLSAENEVGKFKADL